MVPLTHTQAHERGGHLALWLRHWQLGPAPPGNMLAPLLLRRAHASDSSVRTRTTAQLALGERGRCIALHARTEPSAFAHVRSTQIPKSGKLDAKVMQ